MSEFKFFDLYCRHCDLAEESANASYYENGKCKQRYGGRCVYETIQDDLKLARMMCTADYHEWDRLLDQLVACMNAIKVHEEYLNKVNMRLRTIEAVKSVVPDT